MYEKLWNFENLYKAYKKTRAGKRYTGAAASFEMDLSGNISRLSEQLKAGTYTFSPYYEFEITDPKKRIIHALHFKDRVVQHCLCDEILSEVIEPRLIYDNAACRLGKGTHFAMDRLNGFMQEQYRKYGIEGYFLKYDIRKYFDNIDHAVLKSKLSKIIDEPKLLNLLFQIVDGFEKKKGKGLPLGNQSSQWFALLYLDELDRFIKEKLQIKYYVRYMDDGVLIHRDKEYLRWCLEEMRKVADKLELEFNEKTQIAPLSRGIGFLGFHFYLTDTGKVIRRLRPQSKKRYQHKLKSMQKQYSLGNLELEYIGQVVQSYHAHLSHGNCNMLEKRCLENFVLKRNDYEKE